MTGVSRRGPQDEGAALGVLPWGLKADPSPRRRTPPWGSVLGTLGWCPGDSHGSRRGQTPQSRLHPGPVCLCRAAIDGCRGWAGTGRWAPGLSPDKPPSARGATGRGSGAAPGVPAPTHLVGQGLVLWVGSTGERGVSRVEGASARWGRAGPCPPPDTPPTPLQGVTLPARDLPPRLVPPPCPIPGVPSLPPHM